MIPSHSFSTSVSLQTEMPTKKLVVKKKIKQTHIKGNEVKETAKKNKHNCKLRHRNTLRLHNGILRRTQIKDVENKQRILKGAAEERNVSKGTVMAGGGHPC